MKYLIYSVSAKEWFLKPGRGMTDDQAQAHRFTREEAENEVRRRYNHGCEMVPIGDDASGVLMQEPKP